MHSLPIKGTLPRLAKRDDQQRETLRLSPKNRAELTMIVDLVRNDLSRIAAGPVETQAPEVIDLPYVHHLVAEVSAPVRGSWRDWLRALFPAGSITGAPKRAAMQLIRELEQRPRGAYCGSIGWLGPRQGALSVAIRTAEIRPSGITLQAGGGIVGDSEADDEWRELHAKWRPFVQCLGAALLADGIAG